MICIRNKMENYNNIFEEVDGKIRAMMTSKRYRHVIGVVETSSELAGIYGTDIEKCRIAAIFHDYAKQFTKAQIDKTIISHSVKLDSLESESIQLSHSKLAAAIARNEYGIKDEDILNAIAFHTTGRAEMSELEKIIFVADSIEPGRKYPGVEAIREHAYCSLDKAILIIYKHTISYLLNSEHKIHPDSVIARNYFLDKSNEVNL